MVDLPNMKFDFHLGTPFQPFQQLMGVLPAASGEHIPLAYRVNTRILETARDRANDLDITART